MVLGHENMGDRRGGRRRASTAIKVGDRVSVPFNIACGTCRNCTDGWTSFCLRTNPTEGVDGAAYGYANMGPYRGGQAEFLRVPFADFNLLELPAGHRARERLHHAVGHLPDRLPRHRAGRGRPGRHASPCSAPARSGLMAAHSALHPRAPPQVFVVDKEPDRLALAEHDRRHADRLLRGDPVEQIIDATDGVGVDRGVEAVGYQAHDHDGAGAPRAGARQPGQGRPHGRRDRRGRRLRAPRTRGPPTTTPRRAGSAGTTARSSPRVSAWAPARPGQALQPPAPRSDHRRRANPSFIVSHELPLDEAPDAYDNSTTARTAGPRSCCTRTAAAERKEKAMTSEADFREIGAGGETHQTAGNGHPALTTQQGVPVADDQNTLRVGERGPALLEDFHFREKIFHFDHERIPERVVHARGYGAHGYFENYESLADLTRADLFQRAGRADAGVRALLDRRRQQGLGRPRPRRARLRGEALHAGGQLGPRRQQHPGVLHPGRDQVPRPGPRGEAGARPRLPAGADRARQLLGLRLADARVDPHADVGHVGPGHPAVVPLHGGLRRPHVPVRQRRRASRRS